MLGFFRPKPPLGAWEKAWTETQMHQLSRRLGIQRLTDAKMILPTEEYFSRSYEGSLEDAQHYLESLCEHLKIPQPDWELQVCEDGQCQSGERLPDGEGDRRVVSLDQSDFQDPQVLVATLARRLASEFLVQNELEPHQGVADLLTVYLGAGIFTINNAIPAAGGGLGKSQCGTMRSRGHLPMRMLGYALGLFAWLRDEQDPQWASHLRLDAGPMIRNSLRYLRRTNDSIFSPSTLHLQRDSKPLNQLVSDLTSGSGSAQVAALWTLGMRGPEAADAASPVTRCLHARDPGIRAEAALTLGAIGADAEEAMESLFDALRDSHDQVRACAARALGMLRDGRQEVIRELAEAVGDENRRVVAAAAVAIRQHGTAGKDALREVLEAFRSALVQCDNENARQLATTLQAICPDPQHHVHRLFDEHDGELQQVAQEILDEHSLQQVSET